MMDLNNNQDIRGVCCETDSSNSNINALSANEQPEGGGERKRSGEKKQQQETHHQYLLTRHYHKVVEICHSNKNKLKLCKTNLLTTILLVIYLSSHLSLQANLSENEHSPSSLSLQQIATTTTKTNSNNHLTLATTHPSQSFLSSAVANKQQQSIPSISLVSGVHLKRPDEEEDGFIMKAPSSGTLNDAKVSASEPVVDTSGRSEETVTTTGSFVDEQQTSTLVPTAPIDNNNNNSGDDNDDQRIPIDANRQQFVTHDQLLNASTKDENIYLSNAGNLGVDDQPMLTAANTQKVQSSSRAGMSKVSHVSSFLSDLFAYAVRPRPTEALLINSQHDQELANQRNNNNNNVATATKSAQQQRTQTQAPLAPQLSSPVTCPGVCRSLFTASLLCRNEIVAQCPSVFQKCCEKDDVSFNGTPVETSAPINPTESEPNTATLSDNVSQNQDQTTLDQQATLPATSAQPTQSTAAAATTGGSIQQTTPRAPSTSVTSPPPTTTTTSSTTTEKPAPQRINSHFNDQIADGGVEQQQHHYQLLLNYQPTTGARQPASVYFLSSANGSSSGGGEQSAATSSFEQLDGGQSTGATPAQPVISAASKRQQQQQVATEFAQSTHEEQSTGGQRFKSPASQSFDSPLSEKKPTDTSILPSLSLDQQQVSASSRTPLINQVVVLQTANGTIIHQPGERNQFRRPIYANWTDYQLSLAQNRQTAGNQQQTVNYHSNIDPVKRFTTSETPVSSSQSTTTSTAATLESGATTLDTCPGECISRLQQRHCKVSSLSSRCEGEADFCCLQLTDNNNLVENNSVNRRTLVTQTDHIRQDIQPADQTHQLRVINDQHSSGGRQHVHSSTTSRHQTTSTETPTTSTTTTTTTISTTPAPPTTTETQLSGDNSSGDNSQQAPLAGVGNVLVELLDSWISGQSGGGANQQSPGNSNDEQPLPGEQQNDKRLGLDLSFRQQSGDSASPSLSAANNNTNGRRQQVDSSSPSGLMTSDGLMEAASGGQPLDGSQVMVADRCSGYCILRLFTMLCDSTYSSAECGANQECCVSGKQDAGGASSSAEDSDQQMVANEQQQQQSSAVGGSSRGQTQVAPATSSTCRGTCLPVYHASLCAKPSELHFDSPGCLPNHVCCTQQQVEGGQSAYTNHLEDIDGSSPLASNSAPAPVAVVDTSSSSSHQILRDNSLLAALLPSPPPPPISIAATLNPEQQLVHEKSSQLGDQFLAATGRQRQIALPMTPHDPTYQQQLYQQQQVVAKSPSGAQKSSANQSGGGGIMSQLYQMFKSTGRQRQPQQQQQQQQQLQQVANQQYQQSFPLQQQQMYEHQFHQMQSAAAAHLQPPVAPQQLMFSPQTNNMLSQQQQQQQKHYVTNGNNYQMDGTNMMDIKQQQQNRQRYQPQPQLQPQQQQQQMMHKFNAQPPQQQQQPKVSYQQQQVTPVLHPFSDNNNNQPTMMIEKFAVPKIEPKPSLLTYANNNNNINAQLHSQQTPVNYVKSAMSSQQVNQQQQQQQQKQPVNLQQQSSQQQTNFAFPDQRQRYHIFNADNAHHFNQAKSSGALQPLPAIAKPAAPSFSTEQQVKQSNKLDNVSFMQQQQQQTGAGRPHKTQQEDQQQRFTASSAVTTGAAQVIRNGNVPTELDQKSPIVRQHNSNLSTKTVPDHQRQQHPTDDHLVQSAANNQQQRLPVHRLQQQQQPQTTGDNSFKAINRATQQSAQRRPSDTNSLSASSSNLNVLISGAPQLVDLQRVESALEGLRRQVMIAGNQVNQPVQQQHQTHNQPHSTSTSTTTTSTSTTSISDDLSNQSAQPELAAASCTSTCLAPLVAFNCQRPNYIDENLLCPTAGALCCVRGKSTATPTSSTGDPNVPNKKDPLQQSSLAPPQSSSSSPALNSNNQVVSVVSNSAIDSNKLDSVSTGADDSVVAAQDEQPDSSSDADSKVGVAPADTTDIVGEESSNAKSRFQATSCGVPGPRRRTSGQAKGRVMGGFDSKPGYWCWQAALMNSKNEYLCGGALIGTKWVLTAAHCVTQHMRNENQLYVRLGQHNLNSSSSSADRYARTIQVKNSYVHHNHNGVTLDNDIALLRLEEAVDLDAEINQSICLVCLPERSSQIEAGKRCTVTGYGFESESGPAALRVRQTELPIVGDLECQKKTTSVLGKPFTLPASSFCAGGELGQDACHGDGGSPLSCLVDGFYELTGIVSWGYKCGSKDLPGLYSKVSTFVGWINQIVSVNN